MPHPLVYKSAGFGFASMGLKRNPLKRFYGRNGLHFVTFSCYRRRPKNKVKTRTLGRQRVAAPYHSSAPRPFRQLTHSLRHPSR